MKEEFDVIFTVEERIYDSVLEGTRLHIIIGVIPSVVSGSSHNHYGLTNIDS